MTLTANRPKRDLHRLKWLTQIDGDEENEKSVDDLKDGSIVTLRPMEIKTFLVRFQQK